MHFPIGSAVLWWIPKSGFDESKVGKNVVLCTIAKFLSKMFVWVCIEWVTVSQQPCQRNILLNFWIFANLVGENGVLVLIMSEIENLFFYLKTIFIDFL